MEVDRRDFLLSGARFVLLAATGALSLESVIAGKPAAAPGYEMANHWWAMIIDIEKCIGCGNCVRACKAENDVPLEPVYFRTWVERYRVDPNDLEHPHVDSPNGGYDGF